MGIENYIWVLELISHEGGYSTVLPIGGDFRWISNKKARALRLGSIKTVSWCPLKWTTAADFDLAAAYKRKDGTTGLVYFGELGDLNSFPFMQLSGDEGVGDQGGDNEETMRVMKIDDMDTIWILCWDYGAVQEGKTGRVSLGATSWLA